MKRIVLIMAILVASTAIAQEQKRSNYYQDDTILIWENSKAPHSNMLMSFVQART